jgi:hypothetical protein
MTTRKSNSPVLVFIALALWACACAPAFGQPAPATHATAQLEQRALHRRAVEAAIWGMPAVNYDLMLQEMLTKTPSKVGQVIYWGRPLDSKNQTLTPNPDALYFMGFFNSKDGPVVLDLPAADEGGSFNGNIVTAWQMPLEDAGRLGVDKGKGGKYLILPPGYKDKAPDGYIPLQSDTFGGYILLRANMKSHADAEVQSSIAYGKRMKIYPLAQAANPPATVFSDVKDVVFDATIRYDASFFDSLDRVVQAEPWIARDRAMIDTLKSIGIEKGKPFRPSAETSKVLASAVREAGEELEARYDAGLPGFFTESSRWTYAVPLEYVKPMSSGFSEPDEYPIHARGLLYSYAWVGIKHLGGGQFYLISIRDKAGKTFDGGKTYRLTVPPNVPVEQYWSLTAYDRKSHALIKGMPRASCSSNDAKVLKNADGSVDVYFGPKPPAGKESNWVPTDPKREFELMARFYAPTKAFFDKMWKLPDVEEVK